MTVNGDELNELNETFFVNLTTPTNATIADGQGLGTITDDDGTPEISIVDHIVSEGVSNGLATFTVNLTAASGQTVTVEYATANGSATAPGDYQATNGTLTFTPGQIFKTFTVAIVNDSLDEIDETFFVNLSAPQNATIMDGQAVGTITDNDPLPTLAVDDVTVLEGDSGTADATVTVSLNVASGRSVSVNYATANGSAVAPGDYGPANGTLVFAAGETTKSVTLLVNGDLLDEANETFFVNLSSPTNATFLDNQGIVTITDDDGTPALSINDAAVTEGNSGTINAIFTVTLAPTSGQTVTVQYATADGTAVASSDYTAVGNTLTFAPGELTKTIAVPVRGDTAIEANETFLVNLSNATNAALTDGQGLGTITNDDAAPPATAASTAPATSATSATAPATSACASDDRSQAVRAGQGRPAEVGPDAQVASGRACPSLQRPALPQRAQDLHRVAGEAAAQAQGALEVSGANVPAEPGTYTWIVWPNVGGRYVKMLGQSSFKIVK